MEKIGARCPCGTARGLFLQLHGYNCGIAFDRSEVSQYPVIEPPRSGAPRRNNSGNQGYGWKPEISWLSNLKTLCQSAQLLAG